MATESKREQIKEKLQTMMQGISKANGHWNNIEPESVRRRIESFQSLKDADLPAVIILGGEEKQKDIMSDRVLMLWEVRLYLLIKGDDPNDADTHLERFIKDVKSVLFAEIDLGSLAREVEITGTRSDLGVVGFPNYGLAEIELTIEYSHLTTEP